MHKGLRTMRDIIRMGLRTSKWKPGEPYNLNKNTDSVLILDAISDATDFGLVHR